MILQFGCDAVLHYTFGLRGYERVSPKSIIYIYIYMHTWVGKGSVHLSRCNNSTYHCMATVVNSRKRIRIY